MIVGGGKKKGAGRKPAHYGPGDKIFPPPPVALTELDPQALFRPGVNIRPERSDHKLVGCEMHCGRIRDLITHTTF